MILENPTGHQFFAADIHTYVQRHWKNYKAYIEG